ncbi:DUF5133 domain-containing protein [Streptomyces sp. NPDC088757]|uniref:DUF5133 domain-containing protein n=1 Tax=Streptomyces sp. NPDC088757 TaxID=3365889 RepID=UPI0037F9822C
MLMAHPLVLENLVEQYETLRTLYAENGSAGVRRQLEDVTYTLCVSTGTRDIDAALIASRRQLARARSEIDFALVG